MRIVFFGTSTFASPSLRALVEQGYSVPVVVTQPDRPAGRGGKLSAPPIKLLAEELGLPVLQPASCRTAEFLELIRECAPDLHVVAAYGQFLPDPLRTLPRFGSVNLHGSLLPKYRGAAPIQRAIWNGDTLTGVCLMWMVREMDAGDVLDCVEVPIFPEDTAGSLTATLADRAAKLLLRWLPSIENGTAPHIAQQPAAVTFAPLIRKEEREIDWRQSALQIARQIRALFPNPAATTTFRGNPLKILAAEPLSVVRTAALPGTIIEANRVQGLQLATGEGALMVHTLQPAGKRAMSSAEFLHGHHVSPGEAMSPSDETS